MPHFIALGSTASHAVGRNGQSLSTPAEHSCEPEMGTQDETHAQDTNLVQLVCSGQNPKTVLWGELLSFLTVTLLAGV